MTIKELTEECGCSKQWAYKVAKRLGRVPTVAEMNALKEKKGRPPKYLQQEEQKNDT